MPAQTIASKFRRALRNGTGATLTNSEIKELGRMGILVMLAEIETRELCGEPDGQGETAPISQSAHVVKRGQSDGRRYIEALTCPSGRKP